MTVGRGATFQSSHRMKLYFEHLLTSHTISNDGWLVLCLHGMHARATAETSSALPCAVPSNPSSDTWHPTFSNLSAVSARNVSKSTCLRAGRPACVLTSARRKVLGPAGSVWRERFHLNVKQAPAGCTRFLISRAKEPGLSGRWAGPRSTHCGALHAQGRWSAGRGGHGLPIVRSAWLCELFW